MQADRAILTICMCLMLVLLVDIAMATTATVQEQEPKYKIATKASESLVTKKAAGDKLLSNITLGVIQGVDSNPYLDPTKKADNYTQEVLDLHFKYPIGTINSRFGLNVTNVNYHELTDINTLDGIADVDFEYDIFDNFTLNAGYAFELLWYPNDEKGTYVGNEIITGVKQEITDRIYHKGGYRLLFKNYTDRKARLGNMNLGSDLRRDLKNTFEHEFGAYITNITKLRIVNQFSINDSNDQYNDFYDYFAYRVGGSITQILTKNFYNITAFYYKRKNFYERRCSDKNKEQRDNLYTLSTSFLYDITKAMALYINYSHIENHTNEPLERYSDNLYSAGMYISF